MDFTRTMQDIVQQKDAADKRMEEYNDQMKALTNAEFALKDPALDALKM